MQHLLTVNGAALRRQSSAAHMNTALCLESRCNHTLPNDKHTNYIAILFSVRLLDFVTKLISLKGLLYVHLNICFAKITVDSCEISTPVHPLQNH